MLYVCLNPRTLDTKEKLHAYIMEEMGFTADYGGNLDALYDELTALFMPASVLCLRFVRDGTPLFSHAEGFYRVFLDAAKVNAHLRVDVEQIEAL